MPRTASSRARRSPRGPPVSDCPERYPAWRGGCL
jgi:hypothetical protein